MTAFDPLSTAWQDQWGAAADHADSIATEVTSRLGGGARYDDIPSAIVDFWSRHILIIAAGGGTFCPHVDPARPEPLAMATWALGAACCLPCSAGGFLNPPAGTEHVCDRCGVEFPGELNIGIFRSGLVMMHTGFCRGCCPTPENAPSGHVGPAVHVGPYRPDRPGENTGMNRAARRASRRKGGRR